MTNKVVLTKYNNEQLTFEPGQILLTSCYIIMYMDKNLPKSTTVTLKREDYKSIEIEQDQKQIESKPKIYKEAVPGEFVG